MTVAGAFFLGLTLGVVCAFGLLALVTDWLFAFLIEDAARRGNADRLIADAVESARQSSRP